MLMDKNLIKWKLVSPSGWTYFYASQEHLLKAVDEGDIVGFGESYLRMASYVLNPKGHFVKSRTFDPDFANSLMSVGRVRVNEFFDQMESI